MNHIQKSTPKVDLPQLVSPYQLEVAKTLSEAMADNQVLELLASDILYKEWAIWRLLSLKYSKIRQKLKHIQIIFLKHSLIMLLKK